MLSTTELGQLVRRHGQQIRRAEAKQVEVLSQLSDLRHLKPKLLVPEKNPRRADAWPAELTEVVQQALDEQDPHPPEGVRSPNYQQRWFHQQYIGSAHAEKACDLIVAHRQKNQGMHWSEATADALAALKTLTLNQAWDLYWQKRQVLPLAVRCAYRSHRLCALTGCFQRSFVLASRYASPQHQICAQF